MNTKDAKDLRKQLRNICQELLAEALTKELQEAVYKRVAAEIDGKVATLSTAVHNKLKEIDDRSKTLQSYLVRETLQPKK